MIKSPSPPSSRQSPRKTSSPSPPSSRQSPRKTSPPPNLSNIPVELRENVLNTGLKPVLDSINSDVNILNNESIIKYITLVHFSYIFDVNKGFNTSLRKSKTLLQQFIKTSLINICTINLQNLIITKEIVRILNMTDSKKIRFIILRGITFDNEDTLNSFLKFFSKNTLLIKLVLNNIEQVEELLKNLKTYKGLMFLAIINNKLSDATLFIKVLIDLSVVYLTFTYNTVDLSYKKLFSMKKSSYDGIDIQILNQFGWIIKITKPHNDSSSQHIITVNILRNKINILRNKIDNKYLANYPGKFALKDAWFEGCSV